MQLSRSALNIYVKYVCINQAKSLSFLPETQPAVCANSARVNLLHDGCQSLSKDDLKKLNKDGIKYGHILSDDANRMLFCVPPKAGSTFFRNLWLNFTHDVHLGEGVHISAMLRKYNLRDLTSYRASEIQTRLKTYFKFMVTRHPFVKLLSAYRNKLEVPNANIERNVGRFIKQLYFPANQSKDDRVTFEQFVRYIVNRNPVDYNIHWKPITLMCQTCEIHYDYIAKVETSHVDYPYIFSKLKNITDSKRSMIESMKAYKPATDLDRVKKYYDSIPANYMKTLEKTYDLDLRFFGYTWNKTSLSYGCRVKTEGKQCC